jgi:hypothetical protein
MGRTVTGGLRKELHNLCVYSSPNVIRIIKLRRMRRAWNVASMEQMKNAYKLNKEILKTRAHLKELGVDGRIITKWV